VIVVDVNIVAYFLICNIVLSTLYFPLFQLDGV